MKCQPPFGGSGRVHAYLAPGLPVGQRVLLLYRESRSNNQTTERGGSFLTAQSQAHPRPHFQSRINHSSITDSPFQVTSLFGVSGISVSALHGDS